MFLGALFNAILMPLLAKSIPIRDPVPTVIIMGMLSVDTACMIGLYVPNNNKMSEPLIPGMIIVAAAITPDMNNTL